MTSLSPFVASLGTVGLILGAMAIVALIETLIPLQARGRWSRAHLRPNLALTLVTFATNLVFNAALVAMLVRVEAAGFGLLRLVALGPVAAGLLAVLGLDFSTYVAHRALHAVPALWRFHLVHHSDPAVDVTTTIRQHPGEGVVRYAFMAAFAAALGASPGAFAVYRVWSVLHGLLEHANVRVPVAIDRAISTVLVTPNMHKVHHSQRREQTDSNYGNLFTLFDRVFRSFTPSEQGVGVRYGLEGWDDPALQTTGALLAVPFRDLETPRERPRAAHALRG